MSHPLYSDVKRAHSPPTDEEKESHHLAPDSPVSRSCSPLEQESIVGFCTLTQTDLLQDDAYETCCKSWQDGQIETRCFVRKDLNTLLPMLTSMCSGEKLSRTLTSDGKMKYYYECPSAHYTVVQYSRTEDGQDEEMVSVQTVEEFEVDKLCCGEKISVDVVFSFIEQLIKETIPDLSAVETTSMWKQCGDMIKTLKRMPDLFIPRAYCQKEDCRGVPGVPLAKPTDVGLCSNCSGEVHRFSNRDYDHKQREMLEKHEAVACPSCAVIYHRAEGCDHIRCLQPYCRTDFCWHCGGVYDDRRDPNDGSHPHNVYHEGKWVCRKFVQSSSSSSQTTS